MQRSLGRTVTYAGRVFFEGERCLNDRRLFYLIASRLDGTYQDSLVAHIVQVRTGLCCQHDCTDTPSAMLRHSPQPRTRITTSLSIFMAPHPHMPQTAKRWRSSWLWSENRVQAPYRHWPCFRQ